LYTENPVLWAGAELNGFADTKKNNFNNDSQAALSTVFKIAVTNPRVAVF